MVIMKRMQYLSPNIAQSVEFSALQGIIQPYHIVTVMSVIRPQRHLPEFCILLYSGIFAISIKVNQSTMTILPI